MRILQSKWESYNRNENLTINFTKFSYQQFSPLTNSDHWRTQTTNFRAIIEIASKESLNPTFGRYLNATAYIHGWFPTRCTWKKILSGWEYHQRLWGSLHLSGHLSIPWIFQDPAGFSLRTELGIHRQSQRFRIDARAIVLTLIIRYRRVFCN